MIHLLLLSQTYYQWNGSEVEKPGLEPSAHSGCRFKQFNHCATQSSKTDTFVQKKTILKWRNKKTCVANTLGPTFFHIFLTLNTPLVHPSHLCFLPSFFLPYFPRSLTSSLCSVDMCYVSPKCTAWPINNTVFICILCLL